ncbi:hypothetical protein P7K49_005907 [Saguinus oedipus]|uniref:Uncharacterized protein n=1 Tax=Saguinus oedipus TaxID=9490 RepID=A0ABQ9W1N8_SAGOE|nr:hypothetical protein P7K49_005907 [Saguinus oedipus]
MTALHAEGEAEATEAQWLLRTGQWGLPSAPGFLSTPCHKGQLSLASQLPPGVRRLSGHHYLSACVGEEEHKSVERREEAASHTGKQGSCLTDRTGHVWSSHFEAWDMLSDCKAVTDRQAGQALRTATSAHTGRHASLRHN